MGARQVGKSTLLHSLLDGDELERSYKHHLSDYAEWEQRDHASNWMLIEDNLGDDYSGINVPLVAVCNVPPVAQCNVPPQKWLQ